MQKGTMPGMDDSELYFRARDNGAAVFRLYKHDRKGRTDMDQIASVNIRNGETKTQNGVTLSKAETGCISDWIAQRRRVLEHRAVDDLSRLSDQISAMAHWVQSRATADDLEGGSDQLLAAMTDLRRAIVRLKADKTAKSGKLAP